METREERRPLRLFVVCSSRENYYELLRGLRVDGRLVQVEQAPWQDVSVSSYPDQCVVRIRPQRFSPLPGQEQARSFTPDAVLLRRHGRHLRLLLADERAAQLCGGLSAA